MAEIISGKAVAAHLEEELVRRVHLLKEKGKQPCLSVIRVGNKPGDLSYEKGALLRCEKTGIHCRTYHLEDDAGQDELISLIHSLNRDSSVHGVLLLRPLPKGMDEQAVVNELCPEKDVDGMTDLSMSGLLTGNGRGYAPCTAQAAMACLDYHGVDCCGKRAVVIGRSLVFGKPAALLLTDRNATVTLCHTKTRDLPSIARQADILMVAAGHPGTVGAECTAPRQIVIDVGINMGPDHKLCGDVAYDEVQDIVSAITPVPGGVGAVTTTILALHVIEACEKAALTD